MLKKAVEQRRQGLIQLLLAFHEGDSEEQLSSYTLAELEEEYKRLKSNSHPHDETGSLHWKFKRE